MQFSLIALFAALAGVSTASPMALHMIRDCDAAGCAIALGPTAVSCGSAAIEAGANPIADLSCLAGALKSVASIPPQCAGCAAELGIAGPLNAASNAINGVINDVDNAASGVFNSVENAASGAGDVIDAAGGILGDLF